MTAFFNSKLFRFAFKEYFPELLGDTRELSKVFFENVTAKVTDVATEKKFEQLVEKIEKLKQSQRETKHLEDEIEDRLAALYSLSDMEVKAIKASG
ncbi:MAG: hypothetical protein U0T84_05980 [Chitinophagales bacterium]